MGVNLSKARSLIKYDEILNVIKKKLGRRAVSLPQAEAQKALPFIKGEITELKPFIIKGRTIYAASEAEVAPELARTISNFKRGNLSKLGRRLKTLIKSSRMQKRLAVAAGSVTAAGAGYATYQHFKGGNTPPDTPRWLQEIPDWMDNDVLIALLSILDEDEELDMEDVRAIEMAVKIALLPPHVSLLLSQAVDDDIFMLFHPEQVLKQYAIPGVDKTSANDVRKLVRATEDISYILPELKDFFISGKFLADNDSFMINAAGLNNKNLLFKLALPSEVIPLIVEYFIATGGDCGEYKEYINKAALKLMTKLGNIFRITGSTRYDIASSVLREVIFND